MDMRISSHTMLERFQAVAPIAGIPGESLFFHSPSRRRPRISAKVRPRPLIISCRNSKNSGEGCGVVVAERRCLQRRGRWPANSIGRSGPAIRCCARGRTAGSRPGDGDKTTCYLQEKFCCRFAVYGDIVNHRLKSKMFPEERLTACWRPRQDGRQTNPDQAAALVSCTVTLGAAKRISAAAKASISRRSAWRCR